MRGRRRRAAAALTLTLLTASSTACLAGTSPPPDAAQTGRATPADHMPLIVRSALRASQRDPERGCRPLLLWPLAGADILERFDGPEEPWLPGHRGIDLSAGEGAAIRAPDDGTVSFAGDVAGKRVVSLRHGDYVSSFEPAATGLAVGSAVRRGQELGSVASGSDHCDGRCLHWGVRRGPDDYRDPESLASPRRIALKPCTIRR